MDGIYRLSLHIILLIHFTYIYEIVFVCDPNGHTIWGESLVTGRIIKEEFIDSNVFSCFPWSVLD